MAAVFERNILEVPTLQRLCMGKITTHIWTTSNPLDLLVDYCNEIKSNKSKKNTKNYTKFKEFKEVIENITDHIMRIGSLPKNMKIRITLQFLNLVQEMYSWYGYLRNTQFARKSNISIYFFNKTVFTAEGKVDITQTVLRGYFDSYGNFIFNECLDIAYYCFVTPAIFNNYIQNNKYIRDQRLIRKVKHEINKLKVYRRRWTSSLEIKVLYCIKGPVEILIHYYNSVWCSSWTKLLCLVAWFICEYEKKNNFTEKMIFIYNHLDYVMWLKVLKHFHVFIILQFAMSGQSDFCLLFYSQLIKIEPEATSDILNVFMDNITHKFDNNQNKISEYSADIYREQLKYVLLMIWENTPSSLKRDFINKKHLYYYRCGEMFCYYDYEFVKTFIKDIVLTQEESSVLINYLMICHIRLSDEQFVKENLLQLCYDFKVDGPNYSEEAFTMLLNKCPNFCHISKFSDNFFESKKSLDLFKQKISKDHKFLMDVINNFRGLPKAAEETNNFLCWCFENELDAIGFITEHLSKNLVMISVYLNFLAQLRILKKKYNEEDGEPWPSDDHEDLKKYSLFFGVFVNGSSISYDNIDFFHKVLETILFEGKPEDLTEILRIGSNDQETQLYLKSYLLSESGLRDVLKTYIVNHAHNLVYSRNESIHISLHYVCFKKEWLKDENLAKTFGKYLINNCKEVYQKYFKHLEEDDLLRDDNMWRFSDAVQTHYKIFAAVVLDQLEIFNILHLTLSLSSPSKAIETVDRSVNVPNIL